MESILALSVTQNASDLHLSSDENVIIRQNSQLIRDNSSILLSQQLEEKLLNLLNIEQIQQLKQNKQLDFAYSHPQFGRFRVNIFYQKRGVSGVFRLIKNTIPSLEVIQAPKVFQILVQKKQGLILITGATATVNHPVMQGFTAMLGTFFTTIIICSCTAFTILLTGALSSGQTGVELTQHAFDLGVGVWGKYVIFVAMLMFGFKSVIACIYYGEVNLYWLVNHSALIQIYRVIACVLVIVCAMIPVATIWELVDFAAAMLIVFNVPALLLLSKYVVFALRDYARQRKAGINDPTWDYESDIKTKMTNK